MVKEISEVTDAQFLGAALKSSANSVEQENSGQPSAMHLKLAKRFCPLRCLDHNRR
jgi:hypothetical protein